MTIQDYKDATVRLNAFHIEMVDLRIKARTANFLEHMERLDRVLKDIPSPFNELAKEAYKAANAMVEFGKIVGVINKGKKTQSLILERGEKVMNVR